MIARIKMGIKLAKSEYDASHSRYEELWTKIKANPNKMIAVDTLPEFHARLIKAVIKRKYIDSSKHPNANNGKLVITYAKPEEIVNNPKLANRIYFQLKKVLL